MDVVRLCLREKNLTERQEAEIVYDECMARFCEGECVIYDKSGHMSFFTSPSEGSSLLI